VASINDAEKCFICLIVVIGAVDCGNRPFEPCGWWKHRVYDKSGLTTDCNGATLELVDEEVVIPDPPQEPHMVVPKEFTACTSIRIRNS
jgi:hypothetical protein